MATLASGINKSVAYKLESVYGTIPAAASAQALRRVTSTLDLTKDVYQSAEIRTDMQIADYRHGVRRVKGAINGELSPKTYSDFFAAAVKKTFAAGVSTASASITIAGTAPTYTVTRAAGSYLTDGFKVGDVIRLTVGAFNVSNINKNLMITGLTALVATVIVLNGSAMVAEGPIATSTVSVYGKKTFIPTTGQTDQSFSIEHYYSDVVQSEVFSGCKVDKIAMSLPPTGMATLAIDILGQNETATQTQYFTSPTAASTLGNLAAVNGVCRVNGVVAAILTGLTAAIDPAYAGDPVVGSNTVPNLFPGTVNCSGQLSAYFLDNTLRDAFLNETEIDLYAVLTTDNTATADFLAFGWPRIKLGGVAKSDGQAGLIRTIPFQALLNKNGGAGIATELTTVQIQDSAA